MGTAVPIEAVAEQMGRIDQTSKAIMVGLGELRRSVDDLLGVNRAILEQMQANTAELGSIGARMSAAVERLGSMIQISKELLEQTQAVAVAVRENTEEMQNGAVRG
jgi:hypothetical protein